MSKEESSYGTRTIVEDWTVRQSDSPVLDCLKSRNCLAACVLNLNVKLKIMTQNSSHARYLHIYMSLVQNTLIAIMFTINIDEIIHIVHMM